MRPDHTKNLCMNHTQKQETAMSKEQEIKAVAEIALSRMYEIANPNHISVTDSMRFLTSLFDLTSAQALQIVGDALHRAEV